MNTDKLIAKFKQADRTRERNFQTSCTVRIYFSDIDTICNALKWYEKYINDEEAKRREAERLRKIKEQIYG